MILRVARGSAQSALASTAAFAWLGGCGVSPTVIAETTEAGTVSFTTPDAATDDVSAPTDITYCASSKCPEGWTTCPNSRFPCDVNVLRDVDNCGACGNACPPSTGTAAYACVGGACAVQCDANGLSLDCDGIPDNGCETAANRNMHCGACGNECLDPAMPCIRQPDGRYACGCGSNEQYCTTPSPRCVDRDDDNNCGACGNKCDPNNDGGTLPPDTYYGCADQKCGALKCKKPKGNCDGIAENGCETSLITNENCGACGNACADGQTCSVGPDKKVRCMCPTGSTFCASGTAEYGLLAGACVDIATDENNCGACDVGCYQLALSAGVSSRCKYGSCVAECAEGLADCNRSLSDGCEVNTNSDPRNCGGCGILCDAVAGQACVAGRCVVEPCSEDVGGGGAR